MREYRDDDQTVGYCPKCGRHTRETLHGLTVEGQGYCDLHGWVYANWELPKPQTHSLYSDAYREAWGE